MASSREPPERGGRFPVLADCCRSERTGRGLALERASDDDGRRGTSAPTRQWERDDRARREGAATGRAPRGRGPVGLEDRRARRGSGRRRRRGHRDDSSIAFSTTRVFANGVARRTPRSSTPAPRRSVIARVAVRTSSAVHVDVTVSSGMVGVGETRSRSASSTTTNTFLAEEYSHPGDNIPRYSPSRRRWTALAQDVVRGDRDCVRGAGRTGEVDQPPPPSDRPHRAPRPFDRSRARHAVCGSLPRRPTKPFSKRSTRRPRPVSLERERSRAGSPTLPPSRQRWPWKRWIGRCAAKGRPLRSTRARTE